MIMCYMSVVFYSLCPNWMKVKKMLLPMVLQLSDQTELYPTKRANLMARRLFNYNSLKCNLASVEKEGLGWTLEIRNYLAWEQ